MRNHNLLNAGSLLSGRGLIDLLFLIHRSDSGLKEFNFTLALS